MPRCRVGTGNDSAIEIQHEDHGSGPPVVLVHGCPLNGNSWDLIADVRLVRIEGGSHNIGWTHRDEVNRALLEFLGAPHGAQAGA
jgi:pimeloyl-ACP methyl ester carboxylesterase